MSKITYHIYTLISHIYCIGYSKRLEERYKDHIIDYDSRA